MWIYLRCCKIHMRVIRCGKVIIRYHIDLVAGKCQQVYASRGVGLVAIAWYLVRGKISWYGQKNSCFGCSCLSDVGKSGAVCDWTKRSQGSGVESGCGGRGSRKCSQCERVEKPESSTIIYRDIRLVSSIMPVTIVLDNKPLLSMKTHDTWRYEHMSLARK